MSITRRDFIKLFGISVASLYLTRCSPPADATPRGRLRQHWFGFKELATRTSHGENGDNELGQQWINEHRTALDELISAGELSKAVADLVQEAFEAAIYHVWRSNAPITCYEPVFVDYAPTSAEILVRQSEALRQIAAQNTVDPETLAKAQATLEHDIAFHALSDTEVQALYERLIQSNQGAGQPIPSFEALPLEVSPEARSAAQFILELLTGK